ncbi:class I SAM-dependent methyltransferase [Fusibacter sp. JL216-2]|uniref:class I SAM-dependent methyltransferase n=1 Tax=Fusibacter sp. JL216-2 TaxID=3071453 RepID=UPI003D32C939
MVNKSWNRYWGQNDDLQHWKKPALEVTDYFHRAFKEKSETRILDLGCGIGRHALAMARMGYLVTAVDFSQEALKALDKAGQKENLAIETIKRSYTEALFNKNTFDAVLSYNVLYHGTRLEFMKSMEICKSYIKPSGILFFTCPTRDDGKYGSGQKVAPHTYKSENSVHPGDVHYFSDEKDIHDFLIGFKTLSLSKNEHVWNHKGTDQFSSYWVVVAQKLD